MPKKGTNIFKRKDGRWEARYVKSVTADGSKKYGSVYGKTFTEAKEKQELCIRNNRLYQSTNHNLLLTNLMYEWLEFTKNSIKKSTIQKYEGVIRNHIEKSSLGKVNIHYVNSNTLVEFSDLLIKGGRLSAKTINDILIVIGLALSYAEDKYGISKPKIQYVRENRREMRVLSIDEQRILEDYLYSDLNNYKMGILLALYTGMRVGELCALQWDDVADNTIIINKTIQRLKQNGKTVLEITEPKTRSSNRKIPVPDFLMAMLNQYRSYGSVLKNRNGKPVEPRLMQLTFEKYVNDCGLPKTNFHALRHTFATRCIEAGFDIKSLSEILGHTDVKTTLNKYVHSSLEQKHKNMELSKPVVLYNGQKIGQDIAVTPKHPDRFSFCS